MHELRLVNIEDEILERLKSEATRFGVDLNTFIIALFKNAVGITPVASPDGLYHDLDYLSGTWTDEDAEMFNHATADFNKIDDELWK